jgi:hypothetical protein
LNGGANFRVQDRRSLFNIQRHFLDYFLFSFGSLSSLGVFVFLAGFLFFWQAKLRGGYAGSKKLR